MADHTVDRDIEDTTKKMLRLMGDFIDVHKNPLDWLRVVVGMSSILLAYIATHTPSNQWC